MWFHEISIAMPLLSGPCLYSICLCRCAGIYLNIHVINSIPTSETPIVPTFICKSLHVVGLVAPLLLFTSWSKHSTPSATVPVVFREQLHHLLYHTPHIPHLRTSRLISQQLTRLTSHIWQHKPHITHLTSHISRHKPYITHGISHITHIASQTPHHKSYITNRTSHFLHHRPHITDLNTTQS